MRTELLIFAGAFALRMGLVLYPGAAGEVGHTEIVNVARSLASGGGFANPYETAATGPTAHVAPLYPFLLSLLMRLLGTGAAFGLAVHAMAAGAASAQFALLPKLAETLLRDRRSGVVAGFAGALLPLHLWLETSGVHEAVYTGLALVLLALAGARLLDRPLPSLRFCAVYGAGWGVAALLSPPVLPLLFAALCIWLVGIWQVGRLDRAALRCAVVMLAGCAVCILPWTMRNWMVLGTPALVRDNFGLELAVSNREGVSALMEENYAKGKWQHPFSDREEALRMQSLGEVAYYRTRSAAALAWIRSHPGDFARLTLERIFYFWFTPTNSRLKTFFFAGIILGAMAGWCTLWKQPAGWVFALPIVVFPLPFYLVQVSPRYRLPVDWAFWLLAAAAIVKPAAALIVRSPARPPSCPDMSKTEYTATARTRPNRSVGTS
jgi:hypothetical protein